MLVVCMSAVDRPHGRHADTIDYSKNFVSALSPDIVAALTLSLADP